jgi:hypothetical protein
MPDETVWEDKLFVPDETEEILDKAVLAWGEWFAEVAF